MAATEAGRAYPGAAGREDPRAPHLAAFLAAAVVGLYGTSFGPALPFFAEALNVSLDRAGLLITALFAGSITASGWIALRARRIDSRRAALLGLVVAAGGLTVLSFAGDWPLAVAGALLLGGGDGLMVAGTHLLMTQTARDVARSVNSLNLWFAFGAVAGPLWAGIVLQGGGGLGPVYLAFAAVALVVAAFLWRTPRMAPRAAPVGSLSHAGRPSRLPAVMALVLFLYVGAEFGLGLWVASYSAEVMGTGVLGGAMVTSAYWGALAVGRVFSGRLFAAGREPATVLAAAIAGAGLASLALIAAGDNAALGAGAAAAAGLCFGPVWPAALAAAARGAATTAPAALVTAGNAGALVFPWLQGRVLVSAGASTGIGITAALCAAMLAAALPVAVRRRRAGG